MSRAKPDRVDLMNAEFDAVKDLSEAYRRLTWTMTTRKFVTITNAQCGAR